MAGRANSYLVARDGREDCRYGTGCNRPNCRYKHPHAWEVKNSQRGVDGFLARSLLRDHAEAGMNGWLVTVDDFIQSAGNRASDVLFVIVVLAKHEDDFDLWCAAIITLACNACARVLLGLYTAGFSLKCGGCSGGPDHREICCIKRHNVNDFRGCSSCCCWLATCYHKEHVMPPPDLAPLECLACLTCRTRDDDMESPLSLTDEGDLKNRASVVVAGWWRLLLGLILSSADPIIGGFFVRSATKELEVINAANKEQHNVKREEAMNTNEREAKMLKARVFLELKMAVFEDIPLLVIDFLFEQRSNERDDEDANSAYLYITVSLSIYHIVRCIVKAVVLWYTSRAWKTKETKIAWKKSRDYTTHDVMKQLAQDRYKKTKFLWSQTAKGSWEA